MRNIILYLCFFLGLLQASDITIKTAGTTASDNGLSIRNSNNTELMIIEGAGDVSIDDSTLHIDATDNRVGIGTTSPSADLHISGNDGLAVEGSYGAGTVRLLEEDGVGLLFYPRKAAFRVGSVGEEDSWNDGALGGYSFAGGSETRATGLYSFAAGMGTNAGGEAAVALGSNTGASGNYAFATGYGSTTNAGGTASTALGFFVDAEAYASLAVGRYNVVEGTPGSWVVSEPLLVCGNGTDSNTRSNALTLYKNGNMTIAGTLTQTSDFRLKDAVKPLRDVLPSIGEITPIKYRFKDTETHPAGPQIGFCAQEIEQEFPELVTRDSEGYLSIDYGHMSAVLLKAVQEQQAMIDAQQGRIDNLHAVLATAEVPTTKNGYFQRLLALFRLKNIIKPGYTTMKPANEGRI